jgi:hypothetical protein
VHGETTHRGTENTEVAQRRNSLNLKSSSLLSFKSRHWEANEEIRHPAKNDVEQSHNDDQ